MRGLWTALSIDAKKLDKKLHVTNVTIVKI